MNAAHVPAVRRTNTIALGIALVVAAATVLAAIALLSSDSLPDVAVPAGGSTGTTVWEGDWKDLLPGAGTAAEQKSGATYQGDWKDLLPRQE